MNEKLATIEKIINVRVHTNADSLELVDIKGWQSVVKTGVFKKEELCLYIASDTILPEHPEFEFLRDKKFRIRNNTKLRGEISNGICFPIDILKKFGIDEQPIEGMDLTEKVGVQHYEKPIPANLSGLIKGNFPSCIHKTDEIRLQAEPTVLDEMTDKEVYITLKCDGTSFTIVNRDGDVDICSRKLSMKLEDTNNMYIQIANQYDLINKIKSIGNFGIQGEICGPAVQKNRMALKEKHLFVFNIWDVNTQKYLDARDMWQLCDTLHLEYVPILKIIPSFHYTMSELIEMSRGLYDGTQNPREGIVIRPMVESYSNVLRGRLSFKIINPDYRDDE